MALVFVPKMVALKPTAGRATGDLGDPIGFGEAVKRTPDTGVVIVYGADHLALTPLPFSDGQILAMIPDTYPLGTLRNRAERCLGGVMVIV